MAIESVFWLFVTNIDFVFSCSSFLFSVEQATRKVKIDNCLVEGIDLVSSLVEIYNNELSNLMSTYSKLSELDAVLLEELNVKVSNVKAGLKEKIQNLKSLYWKEIFNNLTDITKRLTTKTRDTLLKFLTSNTNIDFTTGNIRSLVIWVIRNANKYYNEQMISVYDNFTTGEGIKFLAITIISCTYSNWLGENFKSSSCQS